MFNSVFCPPMLVFLSPVAVPQPVQRVSEPAKTAVSPPPAPTWGKLVEPRKQRRWEMLRRLQGRGLGGVDPTAWARRSYSLSYTPVFQDLRTPGERARDETRRREVGSSMLTLLRIMWDGGYEWLRVYRGLFRVGVPSFMLTYTVGYVEHDRCGFTIFFVGAPSWMWDTRERWEVSCTTGVVCQGRVPIASLSSPTGRRIVWPTIISVMHRYSQRANSGFFESRGLVVVVGCTSFWWYPSFESLGLVVVGCTSPFWRHASTPVTKRHKLRWQSAA